MDGHTVGREQNVSVMSAQHITSKEYLYCLVIVIWFRALNDPELHLQRR